MIAALVLFTVLGLIFGSFITALTWRIRRGKDWVRGRSQCVNCGHRLAARDLVPLFSWLFLKGRCRWCKKPISWQYPVIEASLAVIFAGSYYFWPGGLHGAGDWLLFVTWLATAVGLMALFVYDFRWMLLPNKILYPTFALAATGRLAYILGYVPDKPQALLSWLSSVGVASGIFLLLYVISKGRWIGYGDVRLGLISGTVLASPAKSLLMIFMASILGTLFALPSLLSGHKKMSSKLPYGPFLIAATIVSLLFGDSFIEWYKSFILP